VIAQNKLQVVICDVGCFFKNQRCETRLLSLQELVKGSRNGGKVWNFSPVEVYCTQIRFEALHSGRFWVVFDCSSFSGGGNIPWSLIR